MEILIQTNEKMVECIPDQSYLLGSINPIGVDERKRKVPIYLSTNHLNAFCPKMKAKGKRVPIHTSPAIATENSHKEK